MRSPGADRDPIYHHEDLRLPAGERDALYRSVLDASRLDPEYVTMLGLSALIALLGLLQNSAAVIIGAMLISPLMNPILAAALALTVGDGKLGRRAAIVLGLSVAGAILVTWVVAWLVPLRQVTPEILARTNPNLLDLFIAFLSGVAGTLALRSGSSGLMIIPGVAIAVAVIPPLAAVGYGLSSHHGALAGGAFLLFVANLVSILISAVAVFLLVGFRPGEESERGRLRLKYRIAITVLVLAILSVPLVQTLRRAVIQVRMRSDITRVLDRAFQTDHSSVADLNFSQPDGNLLVHATLRTTEYFEDKSIESAQASLRERFGPNARLEIDQILVAHGGIAPPVAQRVRDVITGGVVMPLPEPPPYDFKSSQDQLLAHLQKQVDEVLVLSGSPFRPLGPIRAQLGVDQPTAFTLRLASPDPLEPQTAQLLAAQLSAKLSAPVEVHGRVDLEGEEHALTAEASGPRRGLSALDRQNLAKLMERTAERPDLRLQITVSPPEADAEGVAAALLVRQVRTMLARSGLRPDQWITQTKSYDTTKASPTASPTTTASTRPGGQTRETAPTSRPIRCEFMVYQEF